MFILQRLEYKTRFYNSVSNAFIQCLNKKVHYITFTAFCIIKTQAQRFAHMLSILI